MLLGPVVGADVEEWERMLAVDVQGLLYTTRVALPHPLKAAEEGPRRVADIVNISSLMGRVAWNGRGVYNLTKFGVNGFAESLRQEVTQRHVRVGVLEPGGVDTELGSHNRPDIQAKIINPFYETTEVLAPRPRPADHRRPGQAPAALRRRRGRHRGRRGQSEGTPRPGRSLLRTRRQPRLRQHPRLRGTTCHSKATTSRAWRSTHVTMWSCTKAPAVHRERRWASWSQVKKTRSSGTCPSSS
ncbi:SDR family NAD(P)-dependent oxidoreductase [Streptomyces rishiriensis]|uniref:SDR family NAD(P)-dependent oxidoreductase n=1 Tax=Streptomyces rishiriensis TaxID=68264 RepID=UPI001FE9016D|nr:SDR family NAD(P)-dependent oxidoreductase [Streptomyces rishiriensis]